MKWKNVKEQNLTGFWGAEKVYVSPNKLFIIALWDHSQARGWHLYARRPRSSFKHDYVCHAPEESLAWNSRVAAKWASEQIKAMK